MEEDVKTISTEELEVLNPDGIELDMSLVEQFLQEEDDSVQDSFNEDSIEVLVESGEIENGEF